MPLKGDTDFPDRILQQTIEAVEVAARDTLQFASTLIGTLATDRYMRDAGKGAGRRLAVDQGPLRIVSGDLARSYTQQPERNPDAIAKIDVLGVGRFRLTKGSREDYADIHEKGGVTRPRVTPKMRRFAWAKYAETGIDKFKGIALTQKDRLTVPIPARPHLLPAAEDATPRVLDRAVDDLNKQLATIQ